MKQVSHPVGRRAQTGRQRQELTAAPAGRASRTATLRGSLGGLPQGPLSAPVPGRRDVRGRAPQSGVELHLAG